MTIIAEAVARIAARGTCVLLITRDREWIQIACECALRLPLNTESTH